MSSKRESSHRRRFVQRSFPYTPVGHKTEILPDGTPGEAEILVLAAAVEAASEHPLARATVDAARQRALAVSPAENFHSTTGDGVEADVLGRRIRVGQRSFLNSAGIQPSAELDRKSQALQAEGRTVIFVAADGDSLGAIAIADPIKKTTPASIAKLRQLGM